MHSFHPTRYRWILDAIPHCDRPNPRPTPESNRPSASLRQDIRQSFSPVHASESYAQRLRSTFVCDRPNLPQCNPPSLRRGSGKRSACLSTVPSVQTFAATLPNDHTLNSWVLPALPVVAVVQPPNHSSAGRCPLAKRVLILSQAAGAIA
jgi:hypothetical protein